MQKGESKELIPFGSTPYKEPSAETGLSPIEIQSSLVLQISEELENKLRQMGVIIEGTNAYVTLEPRGTRTEPLKQLIFKDYGFEDASAVRFFEKNGQIFMRVTIKPQPQTNKPEHKVFHKITYTKGYGPVFSGGIEDSNSLLQKEFGLTGEE